MTNLSAWSWSAEHASSASDSWLGSWLNPFTKRPTSKPVGRNAQLDKRSHPTTRTASEYGSRGKLLRGQGVVFEWNPFVEHGLQATPSGRDSFFSRYPFLAGQKAFILIGIDLGWRMESRVDDELCQFRHASQMGLRFVNQVLNPAFTDDVPKI